MERGPMTEEEVVMQKNSPFTVTSIPIRGSSMRGMLLLVALAVAFGAAPAIADDVMECEVKLHDDGFIEIEFENEMDGVECHVVLAVNTAPSAADQVCVDACRGLLSLVLAGEQVTVTDVCQALAEGRVDPTEIATLPDGLTQSVQQLCGGAGGQAGGTIVVIRPGAIRTR